MYWWYAKFTICKSQLHVSATKFGHHQVVQIKNLSISYTCIWSGVYIRCRVVSVGARSRKCGECGGFRFGLVGNHVQTDKLCLLITMSRLGYMTNVPTVSVVLYTISSGLSL
jgi:hypothetical protein